MKKIKYEYSPLFGFGTKCPFEVKTVAGSITPVGSMACSLCRYFEGIDEKTKEVHCKK